MQGLVGFSVAGRADIVQKEISSYATASWFVSRSALALYRPPDMNCIL